MGPCAPALGRSVRNWDYIGPRVAPLAIMRAIPFLLFCALLMGCRTNETPEQQVNDLEITAQVKSHLASDVGPSSITNISVNSTNGVVTLSGQVDSEATRSKAEAVAKAVPKVVKVVDSLQIAPAGSSGKS